MYYFIDFIDVKHPIKTRNIIVIIVIVFFTFHNLMINAYA